MESKGKRVASYHAATIHELSHLVGAAGVRRVRDIKKIHIKRRIGPGKIMNYQELYPKIVPNSILDGTYEGKWKDIWQKASAEEF